MQVITIVVLLIDFSCNLKNPSLSSKKPLNGRNRDVTMEVSASHQDNWGSLTFSIIKQNRLLNILKFAQKSARSSKIKNFSLIAFCVQAIFHMSKRIGRPPQMHFCKLIIQLRKVRRLKFQRNVCVITGSLKAICASQLRASFLKRGPGSQSSQGWR